MPNAREWRRKFKKGLHLEIQEALLVLCSENFNEVEDEHLQKLKKNKKINEKEVVSLALGTLIRRQRVEIKEGAFFLKNFGNRSRGNSPTPLVVSTLSVGGSNLNIPPYALVEEGTMVNVGGRLELVFDVGLEPIDEGL